MNCSDILDADFSEPDKEKRDILEARMLEAARLSLNNPNFHYEKWGVIMHKEFGWEIL